MPSRKGRPNLTTATAKENIIAVFNRLEGTAGMAKWAADNPTEFYRLYGRLIPAEQHISGQLGSYVANTQIPVEQRHPLESTNGATAPSDPAARH